MSKRTCLRCKKTKDISEYRRNPHTVDQKQSSCSACMDAAAAIPPSPRDEQAKVRKAEKDRVKRLAERK